MIFTDAEAEKVKEWVIRKLDDMYVPVRSWMIA